MRRLFLVSILVAFVVAPVTEAHTLSYGNAKRAAQRKADAFAGQRVEVNSLFRMTRHRYHAQPRWTKTETEVCRRCDYRPTGATDEFGFPVYGFFDTTQTVDRYCFVAMTVRFHSKRSRRLVTRVTDSSCF